MSPGGKNTNAAPAVQTQLGYYKNTAWLLLVISIDRLKCLDQYLKVDLIVGLLNMTSQMEITNDRATIKKKIPIDSE